MRTFDDLWSVLQTILLAISMGQEVEPTSSSHLASHERVAPSQDIIRQPTSPGPFLIHVRFVIAHQQIVKMIRSSWCTNFFENCAADASPHFNASVFCSFRVSWLILVSMQKSPRLSATTPTTMRRRRKTWPTYSWPTTPGDYHII